jgi:TrmH family RNA methyltransferase
MGAVFGVPMARATGVAELPGARIALVAGAGSELMRVGHDMHVQNAKVRDRGISILIGSEREGLPDDVVAQADHTAHIPIRTHSLNAAMAATVALYELGRRMRAG